MDFTVVRSLTSYKNVIYNYYICEEMPEFQENINLQLSFAIMQETFTGKCIIIGSIVYYMRSVHSRNTGCHASYTHTHVVYLLSERRI